MRHLRPAEAAIDYAQRCHILTHSLPEIDAGATRENDHSALGRVRSVGLFESADGSFPEPRLPHRPENVAPNGTGNEKYDERCCNGSLHVETHTTGEYSICEFQKSSPDRFQMSEWTQTDWRVGMWSAMSAATIGAIFVVVGLIGVVARPPSSEPLQQVDPYLAILETLTILLAVLLVIMMAAMHAYAPPEHKTFSLAALAFVICFAVTTCGVHFASLTIGRQADPRALLAVPSTLNRRLAHARDVARLTGMGLVSGTGFGFRRRRSQGRSDTQGSRQHDCGGDALSSRNSWSCIRSPAYPVLRDCGLRFRASSCLRSAGGILLAGARCWSPNGVGAKG